MHIIEIVMISVITLAAVRIIYKNVKQQYRDCNCGMCSKSCKMRRHFPE